MTPKEKVIKLSEEDEELLRVLYFGNNLSELDINVILSYIGNVKKQTVKEIFADLDVLIAKNIKQISVEDLKYYQETKAKFKED